MGMMSYCKELFKDQKFYFWTAEDLSKNCEDVNKTKEKMKKDDCAILNEHIFGRYHEQQQKVLAQIQDFAKTSIQKKQEKEERLKQFVQEQTEGENKNKATISVEQEVCAFIAEFQDGGNDKLCDAQGGLSQKERGKKLLEYLKDVYKEYNECESSDKCKGKMSQAMQDTSSNIKKFIGKLSEEAMTGDKTSQATKEEAKS